MNTAQTLTAGDLRGFHGSENFYRHNINRRLLYTDGVQYVAEAGGAYWLVDEIALANLFVESVKGEEFQVWILTRDASGSGANLHCEDGNDHTVFSKLIPFTDFPLASIKLYCESDGEVFTLMLPGER